MLCPSYEGDQGAGHTKMAKWSKMMVKYREGDLFSYEEECLGWVRFESIYYLRGDG